MNPVASTTQRCLRLMTLSGMTALISIILFNLLMDPYGIFGLIKHQRPMELVDMSYLTKALALRHCKADTIIIGSSIVDHAFALPGSMEAIYDNQFEQAQKRLEAKIRDNKSLNIYNAGIRNGGLADIYDYLQHAYKYNPNLKHVILGLEYNLFTYVRKADARVPATAPLVNQHLPLTFYANNILSFHATQNSIKTLIYLIKNKMHASYFLPLDRKIDLVAILKKYNSELKAGFILYHFKIFHKLHANTIRYDTDEKQVIEGDSPQAVSSLLFSIWSLSSMKASLDQVGHDVVLNPQAFEILKQITAFTREHDIKLDVYISPQHGIYWEVSKKYNLQQYQDQWMKQLAEITPYWDFSDEIDFANPDRYFNTDALHFNNLAGEIILPTILSEQNRQGFISRKNVNEHLQKRHVLQMKWLKRNPHLQAILAHPNFSNTVNLHGSLDKVLLVEYQPVFKGYQAIKFMDKYLALPVQNTPYNFYLLFTDKHKGMIRGGSLQEIIRKLDSV